MIGLFDRLLRLWPHRCEPERVYTALGFMAKCGKWYCGRIAHTPSGLLGAKNEDEFLDMRRRSW